MAWPRFEYRQVVMAIEARVVLHAPDEAAAQRAARAAFARLDEIDAICSDYRLDSELMRLCAAGGGPAMPVSEDLWAVLSLASEVSSASGRAFDVTCGTLVDLWRRARASGQLPAPAELATAIQLSGAAALVLHAADRSAALAAAGMRLDLGGIAKGYALGAALAVLAEHGAPSAMVAMGGDLALGAPPPGEPGWRIRIGGADHGAERSAAASEQGAPTGNASASAERSATGGAERSATGSAERSAAETLVLSHAAVATSGDASQFAEIGGVRYGHIVDPRTGWALTDGLQCHVVLPFEPRGPHGAAASPPARTAALADALATAACVLGEAPGRALAERLGATEVRTTRAAQRALFDGRTLDGWTTRGGRYDGEAVWTVEDGCITGRTGRDGAGGLLYTVAPHTSFELSLECRLDHPFDSGVFVRMAPDARGAQLTLDDRPDGEIGGLYSDGWLAHAAPHDAWRRDEWNTVVLRCTGFDLRMQAWINGVAVLDANVPQEFGADGKEVFAPRGLIGLQVHGGGGEAPEARARFRRLVLRELPVLGDEAPRGPEHDSAQGSEWVKLTAGPDALEAWEAVDGEGGPRAPDDYRVVDGVLQVPSAPPSGYLRTREDFRDFELRLEFRQARLSNSGVFLRGRREAPGPGGSPQPAGNPAYSGCELQLLDDFHWEAATGSTLRPDQLTASLYGAVPAGARVLRPIGEWNLLEVLCRGSRLAVALNGLTLYDVDTHALDVDPPFAARAAEGFLGLQRYAASDVRGDTALWVRGMRVRRL